MEKSSTSKGKNWGKLGGPSGVMHKWSGTGTQTPGQSSQEGTGSKTGIAPHAGGMDPLSTRGEGNKSYAGTQTPGQSASNPSGGNGKFAEGGRSSMFGNRGSLPAKAGQSAP
jgi:hypothetical protein